MRPIALILDQFNPGRGGLESYAHFLLERFIEKQGEALLLTGPSPVDVPEGVTVQSFPQKGPHFYRAIAQGISSLALKDSHLFLSMRHPGMVPDVFFPMGGLFLDALESRRKAEAPWKRFPSRMARWASKRTRFFLEEERKFFEKGKGLVLCSSPLVAERVRTHFPSFPGSIEVTGLPVDPHQYRIPKPGEKERLRRELNLPQKPAILILWVGNDPKRKGLSQAISILNRLRQRNLNAFLLCLGRSLPRALQHHPYCISTWAPDPSPYYKSSDLLLLPTHEDNYSLSVLEALASGLPVVTTLANGAHIHLQNPALGRVVQDPKDLEALDAATLSLLEPTSHSPSLRRQEISPTFGDTHFSRLLGVLELWGKKL